MIVRADGHHRGTQVQYLLPYLRSPGAERGSTQGNTAAADSFIDPAAIRGRRYLEVGTYLDQCW